MKRTLAALMTLLLLVLPVTGQAVVGTDDQVGVSVSQFSSSDIEGNPINGEIFSQYSASVVCYFATWSQDCLDQLLLLQTIKNENPEYGVFGLLCEDATSTPEAALAIMEAEGYTFPVFLCDDIWEGIVSESVYIPQSFFVNNSGTIVEAWHAAFQSASILRERLAFWASPTGVADGDADENGIVDVNDALLVLRCAMGLLPVTQAVLEHGDMNGSGTIETDDALILLRIALGIA